MNGTAPALHCFVFQSEPCQNGGQCIVTWNDFHCSCPANFTGKFCEERVWCESDPCPEATTCVDVLAGYVCKYCSPVYMLVKIVFLLAKCLQSVFLVRTVAINTNTCCNNSAAISKLGMMPKYALLQAACILWIYYHFVLEQRLYSKVYFFFFPVAMTVSGRSQFTVTPALSSLQCKGHLVFRNVPPFQESQLFDQVRHN